ncbi:MAG: hypothetical protein NTX86_00100 [Candidatus Dependentiae bacterium]|nr:hypothetical protein [Candidatus Dependentiae bacterium]
MKRALILLIAALCAVGQIRSSQTSDKPSEKQYMLIDEAISNGDIKN